METQQQNIRSWDDLIFENRNKSYGAYAIRQSYSGGLLKGILTSTGIVVAILILAGVINKSTVIPVIDKDPFVFEGTTPPIVKPDVKPQTARVDPPQNIKKDLAPVAVIKPDSATAPQPDVPTTSTGTGEPGLTGGDETGTGAPDGTGSGEAAKPKETFIHAEVMPAYRGGFESMIRKLTRNMKYPASAQRTGKEGTVFVEFVVNDIGEVTQAKVVRGFDTACDKEAVRLVNLLNEWSPGMQNKVKVNVRLVLPIKFKLDE